MATYRSNKGKTPWCGRTVSQIDVHVGTRMQARREQLGMSDTELAVAVGISRRTLRSYEVGTVRPTPARLAAIATTLAVPIAFFFEGVLQSRGETKELPAFPEDLDRVRREG
jgi:transcriptional regulator with XRE-family HTH domain